jgi:hypothetical protein
MAPGSSTVSASLTARKLLTATAAGRTTVAARIGSAYSLPALDLLGDSVEMTVDFDTSEGEIIWQ